MCLVSGYPIPRVSWQKNGETIDIYDSMVELQARIDIFDFVPERNTTAGGSGAEGSGFESSEFMGSGSIQNLIGMTNVSSENILSQ